MDWIQNRMLAAKQWWQNQKSSDLGKIAFAPQKQETWENGSPLVNAVRQRSIKPITDVFTTPRGLKHLASGIGNMDMTGALGAKVAGRSIPYITQKMDRLDRNIMESLIDQVRLRKPANPKLEYDARLMAGAMGFNPEVPNGKLVSIFDRILSSKLK